MLEIANRDNMTVMAKFNSVPIIARPGDSANVLYTEWSKDNDLKREQYRMSPEYVDQELKRVRDRLEAQKRLNAVLRRAPDRMALSNIAGWEYVVATNTDGYGAAVMRFAELWARLMEYYITNGQTIEECADRAAKLAWVNEGISGFQYGCAVYTLSQYWVYGEQLRLWHNKFTQIGTEGDNANESGDVLDPASLEVE